MGSLSHIGRYSVRPQGAHTKALQRHILTGSDIVLHSSPLCCFLLMPGAWFPSPLEEEEENFNRTDNSGHVGSDCTEMNYMGIEAMPNASK